MTFRVGMKVCCIKNFAARQRAPGEIFPDKGGVYTIRGFHPDGSAIYLQEIKNPPLYNSGRECSFANEFFRPLTDTKTEISFTTGADPDSEQYDNRRRIHSNEHWPG